MSETKKRNVIIGSLCAVLLLMVVGYAAFSTALKINGTANISSTWNILITDIQTKNIVGGATNAEAPTGEGTLTATFKTNLVSPGDSIEYDITVTNSGSLNATLEKITKTDPNNPAIKFTTSGLEEGSTLAANGGTAVLTVKVEYDSTVTTQPDKLISELKVKLDYVQEGNASESPTIPSNDNVVYRNTTDVLNIGDSIEGINTTKNYNTLSTKYFLKHEIEDNKIKTSEACFVHENTLYCLQPNDSEHLGSNDLINISDDWGSECRDLGCTVSAWYYLIDGNYISIEPTTNQDQYINNVSAGKCTVQSNGSSHC